MQLLKRYEVFLFSFYARAVLCCVFAAAVFGIILATLIPPFQAPDENVHWLAGVHRTLPSVLFGDSSNPSCEFAFGLPDHFETNRIAFHTHEKIHGQQYGTLSKIKKVCSASTLNYGYLGTYPGMLLARLLTVGEGGSPHKAFQMFMLSRLLQGALVLLLIVRLWHFMHRSQQMIPGMLSLSVAILSPLFLQQSFAVSADGITFALSVSLLCFLFFMERVTFFDWALLFYLALSVAATKPPLLPMIPSFLAIGFLRFWLTQPLQGIATAIRSKQFLLIITCIVTATAAALWMVMQDHTPPAHQMLGRDIDIKRQILFVLEHPWSVFKMLCNTCVQFLNIQSLTGPLGWLDAPLSGWTLRVLKRLLTIGFCIDVFAALFVLLAAPAESWRAWSQKCSLAVLLYVSLVVTALCVPLTLYLTWSPVGAALIDGVQARYFFPVALMVPFVSGALFLPLHLGKHDKFDATIVGQSRWGMLVASILFPVLLVQLMTPLVLDVLTRWW